MTCEVSFNLIRHARIDKIQRDGAKFEENGQQPWTCEEDNPNDRHSVHEPVHEPRPQRGDTLSDLGEVFTFRPDLRRWGAGRGLTTG
jgi:hypothetical protein